MNALRFLVLVIGLICIEFAPASSYARTAEPPIEEGFIEITGGKVWYRTVGDGDKTPILLLHGGPGVPSYYLEPLAALGEERPVIFLDQLGCGRSDRHVDTSLMTIEKHIEQLEQVRSALGLEAFYLYGHSWGTMLGMDYYLKHPDRVKGLILASPAISTTLWMKDAEQLIATLPDSIQTAIHTNVAQGTFDAPDYQAALLYYYQRYVARKLPWGPTLDSTFAAMNPDIYEFMWGPSEFTATGSLKTYDRTDQLKAVNVPTLFICGEYDEARPETTRYYQRLVPDATLAVIEEAAHLTMHDNPGRDVAEISQFLAGVEQVQASER